MPAKRLIKLLRDHGEHKRGEQIVVSKEELAGLKPGEDYEPLGTFVAAQPQDLDVTDRAIKQPDRKG